jgi:DNA mismatch endonuclease (patch repair protein)
MRAVKSRDTAPEKLVRKLAHSVRPGYRLHRKDIPGTPDIAYVGAERAIFVHGCFWHGHDCRRGARVPKTNRDYWVAKVDRNRRRDTENLSKLRELGWRALILWECELVDPQAVREKLAAFLT